jgi:hypothetical protein
MFVDEPAELPVRAQHTSQQHSRRHMDIRHKRQQTNLLTWSARIVIPVPTGFRHDASAGDRIWRNVQRRTRAC